jgi:hypothetical protein
MYPIRILISFTILNAFSFIGYSQENVSCHCPGMAPEGKGTLYISAGYNLDWYTTSDIHFVDHTTDNYDFTLYNVKAEDRPGLEDLLHEDITILNTPSE